MRVVITGSRHWTDERAVRRVLIGFHHMHGGYLEIAHGGAIGADTYAHAICAELGVNTPTVYRPTEEEGRRYGRGAPLARNTRMLGDFAPHLVIAFRAAGKSGGTDDTIHKARLKGLPVWTIEEVRWPEEG